MQEFLDLVRYGFSLVGMLFIGRWVFQRNWRMWQKVLSLLVLVGLGNAILNGVRAGMSTANDQMTILDVLATIGIAVVGTWALGRPWARRDWRAQTAVVGVALVVLGLMWMPRFNAASTRSFTSTPSATPSAPIAPVTASPGRWAGPSRPTPPRAASTVECPAGISFELKQKLGCP